MKESGILGLTPEEARERFGLDIRVVLSERGSHVTTRDYKPRRINVETKDGIIVKVIGMG